ncbi:MAG: bifunctional (p)ppGpp synthetase/guanosine-3',5'-bis(diphosphate) 3'-pyrophosphohydrolase [Candidatus Hydrogenedentes bacterium]|nr:bifunctional (p)ppGpp synthetase/guanosine-3',5'-bis(diphosphate) 3'-pyrophosphohydrolase [Candidatus Hydrogenedentota bacterium]
MRTEFNKLLKLLKKNFPDGDIETVRKAYRVANAAHQGQVRLSGEPYIGHSMSVAKIVATLGLDLTTTAAALLHDVLEDTHVTREELQHDFGEEITSLVDGVTKIGALNRSTSATTQVEKQANNLRKMLVATAKDVRVILIKLADRLHNMRTLEYLNPEQIQRISRETLDIYAPLAHRLGIARWKWELEDHAFHHLHPREYKEMAALVAMKRREREEWLENTIEFLEGRLAEAEVNARVIGRPKHLFSIYQKMLQQGKDFDQVMDVVAVRIITQTVAECYNALGVVHHLWTPVPGRFKDYIAMPKANMYQSVHTSVMRENGFPLEIQIRTEEMDRIAREGIAAHWRYKEEADGDGGRRVDAKLDNQLHWLRHMYEWLQEAHAPDELLDSVRRDFTVSDVYVFTPKGEVKELPVGATPLDFAYLIHSHVGHHCIGARVNNRMVPLRYNLQTGDVVEILTSKNQTPHLDWLDFVVTGRARTRIRQRLRELGQIEAPEETIKKTVHAAPAPARKVPQVRHVDDATREKMIRIQGAKGMAANFAKCCGPMPGHPVIGYVTKSPGITIHRADCRNFMNTRRDPDRIVEASWEGDEHFETGMRVTIGQRPNVLADITNAIRPMNISITRAQFVPGESGKSYFDFVFETAEEGSIERVARTIRTVAGVSNVGILPPSLIANQN